MDSPTATPVSPAAAEPDGDAAVNGAAASGDGGGAAAEGAGWGPAWYAVLAIIAAAVLFTVWRPGDAPFVNDEAWLIHNALEANQAGGLARLGLRGSVGLSYGPVPTWIYQALLLVSHDLVTVVALKAALSLTLLAVVLVTLVRRLQLPPVCLLPVFLSPYIYFYSRILWDNSFTLVLSPLYVLAVVETLRRQSLAWLGATVAVGVTIALCHLNTGMMLVAGFLTLLWFGRHWLWPRRLAVGAIILVGIAAYSPYAWYAVHHLEFREDYRAPLTDGLLGCLKGAIYLGNEAWGQHFLPNYYATLDAPVLTRVHGMERLTLLVYLGYAIGLVLAARDLRSPESRARAGQLRLAMHVFAIVSTLFHVLFYAVTRQVFLPHYLVGGWLLWAWFVWLGIEWSIQHMVGRIAVGLHVAMMAALLLLFAQFIHKNGGSRDPMYGHTLTEQIACVTHLNAYRITPITEDSVAIRNYLDYPKTLLLLIDLYYRPQGDPATLPPVDVGFVYVDADDPRDGHIESVVYPLE